MTPPAGLHVEVATSVDSVIAQFRSREFAQKHPGDVWIVGGGQLMAAFLAARAVDEMEIALMPVVLCAGVPMFIFDKLLRANASEAKSANAGAAASATPATSSRAEPGEAKENDKEAIAALPPVISLALDRSLAHPKSGVVQLWYRLALPATSTAAAAAAGTASAASATAATTESSAAVASAVAKS